MSASNDPRAPRVHTRRSVLAGGAAFVSTAMAANALAQPTAGLLKPVRRGKPFTQVGPDEPIRLGIIGPGGMGNGHIDGLLRARNEGKEKLDIVAIAEVCKPRRDNTLDKIKKNQQGAECAAYVDYRDLLDRQDIHAVLIASPEHWHAQHAVDSMEAGKDVYLEKPMCLRLEDALWLKRAVDTGDKILQVGTQYMMWEKYTVAKRLIAEGKIGTPTTSQTSYCRNSRNGEWLYGIDSTVKPGETLDWDLWCGPAGKQPFDTEVYHRWRRYRRWSTGIIGDLLVHQMTPIIYALDLGYPLAVSASGGHLVDKAMENHDNVALMAQFEGGHTMMVTGSTCNDRGLEIVIRGHEADLLLGSDDVVISPQAPFVDDIDGETISCRGGDWQDELRLNWLSCIRTREPNRSTVDLGLKHMVVVDLATRSLWNGGAYNFDSFTGRVSRA
ncbi:MAG: Gfo/Idh/MocA family oxidoreductase [Planctomycetota bacterium]